MENESKNKNNNTAIGCITLIIIMVILGVVLNAVFNSGGSSKTNQGGSSYSDQKSFAITAAQGLVKDRLKSPSTAKFPWSFDEYKVKHNGDRWNVEGYVDSQNSFGAMLRTYWTASFNMGDTSGDTFDVTNASVVFNE